MDRKLIEFLTRFIVESDAIEGIQANPKLVQSQLKAKIQKGHVGAILLLESLSQKKNHVITADVVCRVQGLITAEQHTKPGGPKLKPEWIGKYRLVNVSIGDRVAPSPTLVPSLMDSWISRVVMWQKDYSVSQATNLHQISDFHYQYEIVHPFADGNGRSGRALVYYLMRWCGIEPFIFTNSDKHETYYRCFREPESMRGYFEQKTGQIK